MLSESLTEKYCKETLRNQQQQHLMQSLIQRLKQREQKGYEVPQLAEDLVHLPDLLLVLQVHRSVEVGNFVFFCRTFAHNVVFTWMHELSEPCRANKKRR